jgi:hypothetical protein
MAVRGNIAGQEQAAKAHAAHVSAEKDAEGDRRRSDNQLQKLKPDDLIDQRSASATDEQDQ